jgi:ATP-dependent protease HslVU (ClpYQ) peptidase subunit
MTVVAWDGNILAADRQCTTGDSISTTCKIYRLDSGKVIALLGREDSARSMKRWYENGMNPEDWPEYQKTDDCWGEIVVASDEGCVYYARTPDPLPVLDSFAAWGSGREAALGAMEMGADAVKAVEVASKWIEGCGRGVDYFKAKNG